MPGDFIRKRSYSLQFNSDGIEAMSVGHEFEMAVKQIRKIKIIRMDLKFLPKNSEILGGTVELIVNGSKGPIKRLFKIFPQIDTNAEDGTIGFPYAVIATNVLETAEK
jgi:predicted transcriptional regulator